MDKGVMSAKSVEGLSTQARNTGSVMAGLKQSGYCCLRMCPRLYYLLSISFVLLSLGQFTCYGQIAQQPIHWKELSEKYELGTSQYVKWSRSSPEMVERNMKNRIEEGLITWDGNFEGTQRLKSQWSQVIKLKNEDNGYSLAITLETAFTEWSCSMEKEFIHPDADFCWMIRGNRDDELLDEMNDDVKFVNNCKLKEDTKLKPGSVINAEEERLVVSAETGTELAAGCKADDSVIQRTIPFVRSSNAIHVIKHSSDCHYKTRFCVVIGEVRSCEDFSDTDREKILEPHAGVTIRIMNLDSPRSPPSEYALLRVTKQEGNNDSLQILDARVTPNVPAFNSPPDDGLGMFMSRFVHFDETNKGFIKWSRNVLSEEVTGNTIGDYVRRNLDTAKMKFLKWQKKEPEHHGKIKTLYKHGIHDYWASLRLIEDWKATTNRKPTLREMVQLWPERYNDNTKVFCLPDTLACVTLSEEDVEALKTPIESRSWFDFIFMGPYAIWGGIIEIAGIFNAECGAPAPMVDSEALSNIMEEYSTLDEFWLIYGPELEETVGVVRPTEKSEGDLEAVGYGLKFLNYQEGYMNFEIIADGLMIQQPEGDIHINSVTCDPSVYVANAPSSIVVCDVKFSGTATDITFTSNDVSFRQSMCSLSTGQPCTQTYTMSDELTTAKFQIEGFETTFTFSISIKGSPDGNSTDTGVWDGEDQFGTNLAEFWSSFWGKLMTVLGIIVIILLALAIVFLCLKTRCCFILPLLRLCASLCPNSSRINEMYERAESSKDKVKSMERDAHFKRAMEKYIRIRNVEAGKFEEDVSDELIIRRRKVQGDNNTEEETIVPITIKKDSKPTQVKGKSGLRSVTSMLVILGVLGLVLGGSMTDIETRQSKDRLLRDRGIASVNNYVISYEGDKTLLTDCGPFQSTDDGCMESSVNEVTRKMYGLRSENCLNDCTQEGWFIGYTSLDFYKCTKTSNGYRKSCYSCDVGTVFDLAKGECRDIVPGERIEKCAYVEGNYQIDNDAIGCPPMEIPCEAPEEARCSVNVGETVTGLTCRRSVECVSEQTGFRAKCYMCGYNDYSDSNSICGTSIPEDCCVYSQGGSVESNEPYTAAKIMNGYDWTSFHHAEECTGPSWHYGREDSSEDYGKMLRNVDKPDNKCLWQDGKKWFTKEILVSNSSGIWYKLENEDKSQERHVAFTMRDISIDNITIGGGSQFLSHSQLYKLTLTDQKLSDMVEQPTLMSQKLPWASVNCLLSKGEGVVMYGSLADFFWGSLTVEGTVPEPLRCIEDPHNRGLFYEGEFNSSDTYHYGGDYCLKKIPGQNGTRINPIDIGKETTMKHMGTKYYLNTPIFREAYRKGGKHVETVIAVADRYAEQSTFMGGNKVLIFYWSAVGEGGVLNNMLKDCPKVDDSDCKGDIFENGEIDKEECLIKKGIFRGISTERVMSECECDAQRSSGKDVSYSAATKVCSMFESGKAFIFKSDTNSWRKECLYVEKSCTATEAPTTSTTTTTTTTTTSTTTTTTTQSTTQTATTSPSANMTTTAGNTTTTVHTTQTASSTTSTTTSTTTTTKATTTTEEATTVCGEVQCDWNKGCVCGEVVTDCGEMAYSEGRCVDFWLTQEGLKHQFAVQYESITVIDCWIRSRKLYSIQEVEVTLCRDSGWHKDLTECTDVKSDWFCNKEEIGRPSLIGCSGLINVASEVTCYHGELMDGCLRGDKCLVGEVFSDMESAIRAWELHGDKFLVPGCCSYPNGTSFFGTFVLTDKCEYFRCPENRLEGTYHTSRGLLSISNDLDSNDFAVMVASKETVLPNNYFTVTDYAPKGKPIEKYLFLFIDLVGNLNTDQLRTMIKDHVVKEGTVEMSGFTNQMSNGKVNKISGGILCLDKCTYDLSVFEWNDKLTNVRGVRRDKKNRLRSIKVKAFERSPAFRSFEMEGTKGLKVGSRGGPNVMTCYPQNPTESDFIGPATCYDTRREVATFVSEVEFKRPVTYDGEYVSTVVQKSQFTTKDTEMDCNSRVVVVDGDTLSLGNCAIMSKNNFLDEEIITVDRGVQISQSDINSGKQYYGVWDEKLGVVNYQAVRIRELDDSGLTKEQWKNKYRNVYLGITCSLYTMLIIYFVGSAVTLWRMKHRTWDLYYIMKTLDKNGYSLNGKAKDAIRKKFLMKQKELKENGSVELRGGFWWFVWKISFWPYRYRVLKDYDLKSKDAIAIYVQILDVMIHDDETFKSNIMTKIFEDLVFVYNSRQELINDKIL